jgi:hypothetical protein
MPCGYCHQVFFHDVMQLYHLGTYPPTKRLIDYGRITLFSISPYWDSERKD